MGIAVAHRRVEVRVAVIIVALRGQSLLLQAHAAIVFLLVAVLGHAPLLLQLQGALAFQHLPGGGIPAVVLGALALLRSEEHTSELQSLMRISYAVFCLK